MRKLLHFLLKLGYRFRAYNVEVLKTPGPVLLVPNHVSWLDWLFLYVLLELDWRFVVSRIAAEYSWLHRLIMLNRRTFPIDPASPYAARHLAQHLDQGGRLILFAEGQISRTGCLMKLYEGTGFLLHKTSAQVITCYVRGAHRMRWSRQPGWRRWWPTVSVHFSAPIRPPHWEHLKVADARARLTTWLRDQMVRHQFEVEQSRGAPTVPAAFLAAAREQPEKVILQDATLTALTYRRFLIGADLIAQQLAAVLPEEPMRVGVLLPNLNASPVTLLSLWALGRVPAILNFTTGSATLLACVQLAGLRHVITSRQFLERARLDVQPLLVAGVKLIYLEDLRAQVTGRQKLATALRLRVVPQSLCRCRSEATDAAVVLFTSGSEGAPKGVELTHRNVLANVRQMLAMIDVVDQDRVFNALPIFHSFGLTVGTLLGLMRGLYVFLYPSPLHYRVIPNLFYDRHCTIFLATNTFLNGYARKAHPYDFQTLRYLFAGAEKVQATTTRVWADTFGVRVLEGYGVTECSPVLSVNTPQATRPGSAGRFLPGIEFRLEPVDGVPGAGRLLVRGPNVMRGYLNPEADAAFQALHGWYDTGDIAMVDEEGFVHLRGRLKRFAKVSGEMVSLAAVEEALAGAFPQHGPRCEVAVIACPDEDKGEALVAVTNQPHLQLDEIRAALRRVGLSNLCVPRSIQCMRELPRLGSGKIDHREVARLVEAKA